MTKIILGIIFAISFHICGYSALPSAADSPVQQLANILSFFKKAELCDRDTQVFVWHDDFDKWDIRFQATLTEDECPDEVCDCMLDYINQNNWLGPKLEHTCIQSENCVTLVLSGPSVDYDPTNPPVVTPISSLCGVLKNFKNPELGDHECTSKCTQDGTLTRLELKCELTCESPSPIEARDMIVNYLNQSGLLAKATVTAKSDGKFITIIVLGE